MLSADNTRTRPHFNEPWTCEAFNIWLKNSVTKCSYRENRRVKHKSVKTLSKTTTRYQTRLMLEEMDGIKEWNMFIQNRHGGRRGRGGCCCLQGLLQWRWPGITPVPSHNLSLVSAAHRPAEWAQSHTSQNKSAAKLSINWEQKPKLGRRMFSFLILVNKSAFTGATQLWRTSKVGTPNSQNQMNHLVLDLRGNDLCSCVQLEVCPIFKGVRAPARC